MDIKVVSETIDTHVYESQTLAKAFSEITGINLTHDLIQEGDVIEKLQTQMQSDQNIYDAYINDSDLVGTHFRYDKVVPLSDWMAGEGKDVTLPTLDVDDFMGKSFTTGPDNKLYQLPDQQFANLYWFRYDWFTDPQIKEEFKKVKRLRARRAGQLVGLRGHRRLLHQPREGRSTACASTATWTTARRTRRSAGASPTPGCRMAGDERQGHPQRPAGRRVGHPHGGLPPGRLLGHPRRRHQRPGCGLRAAEVHRLAEGLRPAGGRRA